MPSSTTGAASPAPRPWAEAAFAVVVLVLALAVLLPGPATAAEGHGEESTVASVLVLQSISLIANDGGAEAAAEKLVDALEAPEKEGTDLGKVEQALALIEGSAPGSAGAPALARAREILVSAIAVRSATGYGEIPEPGMVGEDEAPFATGADTGTVVVLDGMTPARGIRDGGDAVLLGLAVLMVIAGVVLSRRWRPMDTIRELRRQSAAVKES